MRDLIQVVAMPVVVDKLRATGSATSTPVFRANAHAEPHLCNAVVDFAHHDERCAMGHLCLCITGVQTQSCLQSQHTLLLLPKITKCAACITHHFGIARVKFDGFVSALLGIGDPFRCCFQADVARCAGQPRSNRVGPRHPSLRGNVPMHQGCSSVVCECA